MALSQRVSSWTDLQKTFRDHVRHMYPRYYSTWKRLSAGCYFKDSISRNQTIAETQNYVSISKENPSIAYYQGTSTLSSFPQQWGQIDCIELNTCGDLFSLMTTSVLLQTIWPRFWMCSLWPETIFSAQRKMIWLET